MVAIRDQDPLRMTEAEYLAFERESDVKHEFVDGKVYAMSGGSARHSFITVNTSTAFNTQLANTDCRVASPDLRLKVQSKVAHRYPDVMVICGDLDYVDNRNDTIQNPIVIVEVLSPSTELIDRNQKLQEYRALPTLQEYILISQHEAKIERYFRQTADDWLYTSVIGLDNQLALVSIDCTLKLSQIYQKITLDAEDE